VSGAPELPWPPPGSVAYLVALYSPAAERQSVRLLWALAEEIGQSLKPGLDHELAHLRLGWWRQEQQRHTQGRGEHPWTRQLPPHLSLEPLLAAAELALATGTPARAALEPALLTALAHWLGPEAEPLAATIAALPQARAACGEALTRAAAGAHPPTPLLIWATLALRRTARAQPRPWQALTDTVAAWRAARRALPP
jgi:hypothetical protein